MAILSDIVRLDLYQIGLFLDGRYPINHLLPDDSYPMNDQEKQMDTGALLAILEKTDPFALLEREVISSLCSRLTVRTVDDGTYVFRQGDSSIDCLFIIADGLVEIVVEDEDRVEKVMGVRQPFDFFGETAVLSGQPYPGSARSKGTLTCICISRHDLETLIYSHPEFSVFFNRLLADRMRILYAHSFNDCVVSVAHGAAAMLFRKQVSQVMSAPVLICREEDPVSSAARTMIRRKVGCLVVVDDAGHYRGILTERQLVDTLVVQQQCLVEGCRVVQLMDQRLFTIAPEAYLGEALASVIRNRIRQLVVLERNRPVGIVTFSDLVRSQSVDNLMLVHDIAHQTDIDALASLSTGIDQVLDALVAERAGIRETMEIMSRLNNRITRKVIELSQAQLQADGWGAPPVDYCWINMGSAARLEQTLRTDQDNAIIYADPEKAAQDRVKAYFRRLATTIVDGLVRCGFKRCSGNVMASNPQWCRSISEWCNAISDWMTSLEPNDTRMLTIFLDYRCIWGDTGLADRLWGEILKAFTDSSSAGAMFLRDDQMQSSPVGFMGKIVTERKGAEKGRFNLKRSALMHMINAIRLLALGKRISNASTLERLDQLAGKGVISAEDAAFYRAGFETLMMFRIRENLKQVRAGQTPDNTVDPKDLNKHETLLLKDALSAVTQLQKRISKMFFSPWVDYFAQFK